MRIKVIAAIAAGLMLGTSLAQQPSRPPAASPQSPAATTARLSPGTAIPSTELEALVDGVIRSGMSRDHIAGVAVSVVQGGRTLLKKGYGFAGPNHRVDPDTTLFRIGSVSKTFTWIAAMQEVEAGRMRLDQPLNDYLPKDLAIPTVPDWRPVELRDAMSHTSGFEERILDQMFVEHPSQMLPLAGKLRSDAEMRVFAPGAKLAYSNLGVILTGAAVAHLESSDFQSVIDRKITGPLGMIRTTFREPYPPRADLPAPMPPALAARVSTAYRWTANELKAQPFEWISHAAPAGSASSTAGDMTRYMLMILGDGALDGTRIYGTATAAAFRTPIRVSTPNGGVVNHGFLRTHFPGGFTGYGHDGDTMFFHSNLVTIPALGLGIFITTNTDTGGRLSRDLPQLIVERFYAAAPTALPTGSPGLAATRDVYAGTFLSNRRAYWGLEKFVGLMTRQVSVDVTPEGYLVTRSGNDAETWFATGGKGHFQAVDGTQTIDFGFRDGKAVTWYEPDGTVSFDRIGPVYQRGTLGLIVLLVGSAAVLTLIGGAWRFRRALTGTLLQSWLGGVQIVAAGAWLVSLAATVIFVGGADDQGQLVFSWPGSSLVIASLAALIATLLSFGVLVALPFAWKRGDWGLWRGLRFALTSLLFSTLGLQLACWGFLQPWAA